MSKCHLNVRVEKQFTFVTERNVIRKILHDLADKCREVKLQALVELRLKKDCVLVKLILGRCECDCHCEEDLNRVLRHHCVKSHCQKVLVVDFGKDVVRDLAFVSRRFDCKVDVSAFYFDRCGNGVYQVSSLHRAKRALGGSESKSSSDCGKQRWFERHGGDCRKECSDRCEESSGRDRRKCRRREKDCSERRGCGVVGERLGCHREIFQVGRRGLHNRGLRGGCAEAI